MSKDRERCDTRRPSILLVDDERPVLRALRRVLTRDGYDVRCCDDPIAALAVLRSARIDVIVCDLRMPAMGGLELLRQALQDSPRTVRIVITAYGTAEAATRAINEGEVHRFLLKPIEPSRLRREVADAIARQSDLDAAACASVRAQSRRFRLRILERKWPGSTRVPRDEHGDYRIDEAHVHRATSLAELGRFIDQQ